MNLTVRRSSWTTWQATCCECGLTGRHRGRISLAVEDLTIHEECHPTPPPRWAVHSSGHARALRRVEARRVA